MGVQINGDTGNVIATKGTFSGDVGIGGTLTYEDVTNIDSVGLITARSGLEIGARPGVAASVSVDGNAIFSGITTVGGNLMVGDIQTPEKTFHVHGNALIENTIGNNFEIRSTVNNGNDPNFYFSKARGGGTPAIVQNGDDIGNLQWRGYDGDSYEVGASILAEVEGTPSDGDMPMRMTLKTRSAGAGSEQGRIQISADGTVSLVNNSNLQIPDKIIHSGDTDTAIRFPAADTISVETGGSEALRILNGGGILKGHNTASTNFHDPQTTTDRTPNVQIHGGNSVAASAALVSWNSNSGSYYSNALFLAHSGSSTIGTNSIVSGSNTLGSIVFSGDDGDEFIKGAMISAHVDGTPGANDMPTRLQFFTNGGSATPSERARITSDGYFLLATTSEKNLGQGNTDTGVGLNPLGRLNASRDGAASLLLNRNTSNGAIAVFYRQGVQEGNISITTSAVAYNTSSSDRTLKKNFEDWTENTLDLFKSLKPQKFNFIHQEDSEDKIKGYVAQDLVDSFPEAYPKDDDGKYQFNPSGMVVYLMKAIQELKAEVEQLKSQLNN